MQLETAQELEQYTAISAVYISIDLQFASQHRGQALNNQDELKQTWLSQEDLRSTNCHAQVLTEMFSIITILTQSMQFVFSHPQQKHAPQTQQQHLLNMDVWTFSLS